jgi:hypothetical protein
MKTISPHTLRAVALSLLVVLCILRTGDVALADGATAGLRGAVLDIPAVVKSGTQVRAVFDLDGYEIAKGSYASINVDVLKSPAGQGPTVRTGYPATVLTFHVPGTYELRFILNEISKPSCGGVNARLLLETTATVDATP